MHPRERHDRLADLLAAPENAGVVDLGCGAGLTMAAIAGRLGPTARITGVDRLDLALLPELAADPRVDRVTADLRERLPFHDAGFDSAVCHNTLESLPDPTPRSSRRSLAS